MNPIEPDPRTASNSDEELLREHFRSLSGGQYAYIKDPGYTLTSSPRYVKNKWGVEVDGLESGGASTVEYAVEMIEGALADPVAQQDRASERAFRERMRARAEQRTLRGRIKRLFKRG